MPQSGNSIQGVVKDKQTGIPLANVNVYLAYTLIGTTTDGEGNYHIKSIPSGSYNLIVSHIQYTKETEPVSFLKRESNFYLDFALSPKIFQLPEVIVEDDSDDWWQLFDQFREELLGFTENADSCEILNPTAVNFSRTGWYDTEAVCTEPLYIINTALGYKITYDLEYFFMDGIATKFTGTPFFEELEPYSTEEEDNWFYNRENTYYGSLRDFLHNICERQKNNSWESDPIPFDMGFKYPGLGNAISIASFSDHMTATDSSDFNLHFSNKLSVWFDKYQEDEPFHYSCGMELTKDTVSIDYYGRTYDKFGIKTTGYWSKQRLGDMLPMEYFPPEEFEKTIE